MRTPTSKRSLAWYIVVVFAISLSACTPLDEDARRQRSTLVLGIDVSGSFEASGNYDDAIEFASHYLYGHFNGFGELAVPSAVFVGSVGGERPGETKSFQPIHAFQGKSPEEIETVLREQFPSQDGFTDFNAFFDRVSTLVKRQGLTLTPLNVVLLSDGIPDPNPTAGGGTGDEIPYAQINLNPLEYLARSVTVRLLYATPTVCVAWERSIERRRVRMWTVDFNVMRGWREQMELDASEGVGEKLWEWVSDNVDFRVRTRVL
jgi:hypothetical protein